MIARLHPLDDVPDTNICWCQIEPGACDWPECVGRDKCRTCRGAGRVNPLTSPTFVAGVADCPHCDGTGRV